MAMEARRRRREINQPQGVAVDAAGNVYISDTLNNRIRKVDTTGVITTIAGNGTAGSIGDGGAAAAAEIYAPVGITLDAAGNLYFADSKNNRIRKIDTTGVITTYAGKGAAAYTGTAAWRRRQASMGQRRLHWMRVADVHCGRDEQRRAQGG